MGTDRVRADSRTFRLALFVCLALGGVTLDLVSKHLIFAWRGWQNYAEVTWLIDNHLGIETHVNQGALFGMGEGYRLAFVLLSFVALVAIGYFVLLRPKLLDLWLTLALGLVTGGILGNLYDRLGLWHTVDTPDRIVNQPILYGVRDWILFKYESIPLFNPWPNFNIADCCLVVGACLLAVHSLRGEPKPAAGSTDQASTR